MTPKNIKHVVIHLLKFGFAAGIIYYLITSGRMDVAKIKEAFFHSPWVIFALVACSGTLISTTFRWWFLIRSQGIELSLLKATRLVFIGYFFNIVIPGTISGDVVKVYYVTRDQKNKIAAGFSVLMDRLMGLIMLTILTFLAVLVNYSTIQRIPELRVLGFVIMGGFVLVVLGLAIFLFKKELGFRNRLPKFIKDVIDAFWAYRNHKKTLAIAAFCTVLNYTFNVLMFYGAARAVGENVIPFLQYFLLIPVGLFIMAIPIAPVGLGVGQGVFLALFSWAYGRPVTIGADMVTVGQMVIISWALVGLVVYLFYRKDKVPSFEQVAEES